MLLLLLLTSQRLHTLLDIIHISTAGDLSNIYVLQNGVRIKKCVTQFWSKNNILLNLYEELILLFKNECKNKIEAWLRLSIRSSTSNI